MTTDCVFGTDLAGTILAAAPARMRNVWYPNKNARYMTLAEIKIAKQEDLIRERDLLFGKEVDQKSSAKRRQAPQVDISVTQLPVCSLAACMFDGLMNAQPQRSFEILDRLLPPSIEFRKFKIPTGPTDKGDQTPANAIFGSVTTTDIVVNMKALLAEKAVEEGNADAAKVVLTAEDVRIRQGAAVDVETDRVKTLGDFEIEIQVKGASTVKRTLRVLDEAD